MRKVLFKFKKYSQVSVELFRWSCAESVSKLDLNLWLIYNKIQVIRCCLGCFLIFRVSRFLSSSSSFCSSSSWLKSSREFRFKINSIETKKLQNFFCVLHPSSNVCSMFGDNKKFRRYRQLSFFPIKRALQEKLGKSSKVRKIFFLTVSVFLIRWKCFGCVSRVKKVNFATSHWRRLKMTAKKMLSCQIWLKGCRGTYLGRLSYPFFDFGKEEEGKNEPSFGLVRGCGGGWLPTWNIHPRVGEVKRKKERRERKKKFARQPTTTTTLRRRLTCIQFLPRCSEIRERKRKKSERKKQKKLQQVFRAQTCARAFGAVTWLACAAAAAAASRRNLPWRKLRWSASMMLLLPLLLLLLLLLLLCMCKSALKWKRWIFQFLLLLLPMVGRVPVEKDSLTFEAEAGFRLDSTPAR